MKQKADFSVDLTHLVRNTLMSLLVLGVFLPGCSCSREEVTKADLGRRQTGLEGLSAGRGSGSGELDGDGNAGNGAGAGVGEGGGDAVDGNAGASDAAEGDESQGQATSEGEDRGKAASATGQGRQKAATGESDSASANPTATERVKAPPALPGRKPKEPRYSPEEAVQVAAEEIAVARRARSGGDLSAAYEAATKAYAAVFPHAEADAACKQKAEQAEKLLELIAKQQPPPADVSKPTVFE